MIGVVLAGGASARFGGKAKGLLPFRGQAMALAVADVLAKVCTRVAIEALPDQGYEALGFPLIQAAQAHSGKGPLAGIVAGLAAAGTEDRVAFAPCDMPLLTADVYHVLMAETKGAFAVSPRGSEALVAVLSPALLPSLSAALAGATVARTDAALIAAGARGVAFADAAAFANVNSPDDLARLSGLK